MRLKVFPGVLSKNPAAFLRPFRNGDSLLHAPFEADLVDFYGKCRGCGQSGGHHFACDQCPQSFPSSYAREVHMKFFHAPELSSERKPMGLRKLQERLHGGNCPHRRWAT
ncbi:unnamed protein product [Effrenium voratum]|nr:unnamed protein product [Effrenium voratum]